MTVVTYQATYTLAGPPELRWGNLKMTRLNNMTNIRFISLLLLTIVLRVSHHLLPTKKLHSIGRRPRRPRPRGPRPRSLPRPPPRRLGGVPG